MNKKIMKIFFLLFTTLPLKLVNEYQSFSCLQDLGDYPEEVL